MPSSDTWLEWSRNVARPYWHRNHQLFIEVAMASVRYCRDARGMSRDSGLANVEHYWFARYMVFLVAGATGDVAATGPEVISPSLAQLIGRLASYVGGAEGAGTMTLMAGMWELFKRVMFALGRQDWIPGGRGPASQPGPEQLEWAMRGVSDGLHLDVPYADQMRWGQALDDIPGRLILPAPPR